MGYSAEIQNASLAARLNQAGQGHVLRFLPELSNAQRTAFENQLAELDWDLVARLVEEVVRNPVQTTLSNDVKPAPFFEHKPAESTRKNYYKKAFCRGEELLREGKIAAFVVAGGQGSRLGWEAPKGTFPGTPVKKKPLFQCFAEFLLELGRRYNRPIPFYVLTSPMNYAATVKYWQESGYFGMDQANVMFFVQDSLPAIGLDGRVLLERKDSLALSPNGHGGSLLALWKGGAIADMKRRGVTQISYFQVDNPIVRCVDPMFIGLHELEGAEMSSKMLPKTFAKEKLGNFALIDGKMSVIEYSDLPDVLAEERLASGQLRFQAGSIALHAIRVDFVEDLSTRPGGFALPYHRAEKKVPCIDPDTGAEIKPEKVNAIKCETFVFDALPLTKKSIIYETDRIDEFAPIKQPEGVDSVVSSREIVTRRNADWLEKAGVKVPRKPDGSPDCVIEIAASMALYPHDLKGKTLPAIGRGEQVYLG